MGSPHLSVGSTSRERRTLYGERVIQSILPRRATLASRRYTQHTVATCQPRQHFRPVTNYGWTYNHQPMMCHWNGRFYVHFLCDSTDEHIPPSRTMLMTSDRRLPVEAPVVLFPTYKVPDGIYQGRPQRPGQEPAGHHAPAGGILCRLQRPPARHGQLRHSPRPERRPQRWKRHRTCRAGNQERRHIRAVSILSTTTTTSTRRIPTIPSTPARATKVS